MPHRLIQLLLLAASLYGTGAAIVAFTGGASAEPRHAAVASIAALPAPTAISTVQLQTITVRPETRIPTLGTITVRPSRADLAEIAPTASDDDATDVGVRSLPTLAVSTLQGGAFGMPYYSFGKSLHHASKE